eukprot:CAMPEP_0119325104 /NCGR_PEP_ID=MMETSP1333-20130426/64993_1 /TAXON_ID=418940 /ORGANISM="Scyphosphaera apsteinii, Strain RCC1455" /LENGTH=174 /DNA_ID=CAMNT_0007332991 /DNA_START=80 /DNA_END=600 /DNA_ORIENTATION=+
MSKSFVIAALERLADAKKRSPDELSRELREVCLKSTDRKLLRQLIAEGASVNTACRGQLPLWNACRRREPSFAQILIESSADVNALSDEGHCAFVTSCMNGNLQVMRALLAAGASINICDEESGCTGLYAAAMQGRCEIVMFLSLRGASRTAHMRSDSEFMDAELPELLERELR